MDVNEFLQTVQRRSEYRDQIAHIRKIPARQARYRTLSKPLPAAVEQVLAGDGITELYEHQAHAVDAARAGRSLMVVTGTASGKTLCYNLPVLEALLEDEDHRAMYLFPTKALAQDQLAQLERWAGNSDYVARVARPACYDGDTPSAARAKIRQQASIILTNPDMVHQGILPYHAKFTSFLANLRYIVIDEAHVYRGIFGSHVANVIRRLRRILDFHGASCQFICCSATIGNPQELGQRLIDQDLELIDTDGSPRGTKYFIFWNPPHVDQAKIVRRSANIEAKRLFAELIRSDVPTIAFCRARVVAELLYKYAIEDFVNHGQRPLADKIKPYRGGYLPKERRQIEHDLFAGNLIGVCATTALELGIDVGSLDAAVLIGFPGTISSAWQQAGRAGRRSDQSLAVLVAYNDPIDQYLMHHPDYFFARNVERAILDPANPHILRQQLACAAFELPLAEGDEDYFGPEFPELVESLTEDDLLLSRIIDRWYYANSEFPARNANLRTVSDSTYAIVDMSTGQPNIIGDVDSISAPEQLYPGAVYLHDGDSYLVCELDLDAHVAYVAPADVDYYTQPVLASQAQVLAEEDQTAGAWGTVTFGQLLVVWETIAFKKIRFYTMEVVGHEELELPEQELDTQGLWFEPDETIIRELADAGHIPIQALAGLRNLMIWALPILAMCDHQDVGGQVNVSTFPRPTIVLYDRYLGGLGFARRGYDAFGDLLEMTHQIITECPCDTGCPSCVGLPLLRPPIHQDPDLPSRQEIPDKHATAFLLDRLLEHLRSAK